MQKTAPADYSRAQIALHWAVAVLVAVQYLLSEGMEAAYEALNRGFETPTITILAARTHVVLGVLILLFVIGRLSLRRSRGVPPPPPGESALLRRVATITHWTLYVLILLIPVSGGLAWFGGIRVAAAAHGAATSLLLPLVALHAAAALVQHFVLRTAVLRRMMGRDNATGDRR